MPNYWVKDLQLSQRESHVLISDLMLNAYHIGAATYLLRKIDPKLGGCDYQTRLSLDVSKNRFSENQRAVQIIHAPNHWQLLTREGQDITFYCSLANGNDPSIACFSQELMRGHLGDCFENQMLEEFPPPKPKERIVSVKSHGTIEFKIPQLWHKLAVKSQSRVVKKVKQN